MRIISLAFLFCMVSILPTTISPACAAGTIASEPWGSMPDGTPVELFTLVNANGVKATITTYGATITSLYVPDRKGEPADVVLGFDHLAPYVKDTFGQTIGRFAGRIALGRFTLDGVTYQLPTTGTQPVLHGGGIGYHMRVWSVKSSRVSKDGPQLTLTLDSPNDDQDFPGDVAVTAAFTLENNNALRIDFEATSDKPTPINLTEHTYFNLAGDASGDVLGQMLTINSDRYCVADQNLTPTGEIAPVAGTPLDFRSAKQIGRDIDSTDQQIVFGHGFDHNFVLNRKRAGDLELAAQAKDPASGRVLEVWTTQPALQLYTANWLNSSAPGVGGRVYTPRSGFALETQHFPDGPNHSNFPNTILRPGRTYHETTVFKFSTTDRK